jgi:hypothetical protein
MEESLDNVQIILDEIDRLIKHNNFKLIFDENDKFIYSRYSDVISKHLSGQNIQENITSTSIKYYIAKQLHENDENLIQDLEDLAIRHGNYMVKIYSILKNITKELSNIANDIKDTEQLEDHIRSNLNSSQMDINAEIKLLLFDLKTIDDYDKFIDVLTKQILTFKNANIIKAMVRVIFEQLPEPIMNETYDKFAIEWDMNKIFKNMFDQQNKFEKSSFIAFFHFIYHAILKNDELKEKIDEYFKDMDDE